MPVKYVPRTFGGTLILNIAPAPPSTLPTLVVVARFRDGTQQATYRDGKHDAAYRDGVVTSGGR